MPNWAEGTIKLRGKEENLKKALKYMFSDKYISLRTEYNDSVWDLSTKSPFGFYIKGTTRAFIGKSDLELWFFDDNDLVTIEITEFKQAWAVEADEFKKISSKFDVDIKIFAYECGMEFTQEIEISKGKIIKDEITKYDDYRWEVPFSSLGG